MYPVGIDMHRTISRVEVVDAGGEILDSATLFQDDREAMGLASY